MNDVHTAWWWLLDHPMFAYPGHPSISLFYTALHIMVMRVNPLTDEVDDDRALNTRTEIWLECGPVEEGPFKWEESPYVLCHDYELDCGEDTFERAVISLAALVLKKYGDYDPDWFKTPEWHEKQRAIRASFPDLFDGDDLEEAT